MSLPRPPGGESRTVPCGTTHDSNRAGTQSNAATTPRMINVRAIADRSASLVDRAMAIPHASSKIARIGRDRAIVSTKVIVCRDALVSGSCPLTTRGFSNRMPTITRVAANQSRGPAKTNVCQVSAVRPVIAQTGGKSLAASCAAQIWTRSGRLTKRQPQQLVEAAIKACFGDDPMDGQQHAGDVRLAAGRAVGDRQRLARQPEDHLLVRDESR